MEEEVQREGMEDVRVVCCVVFGWILAHLVVQVDDNKEGSSESDDNQGDGSSGGGTSALYTFRCGEI